MVRVSVFDHDCYARTHLPLVAERLKPFGLLRNYTNITPQLQISEIVG